MPFLITTTADVELSKNDKSISLLTFTELTPWSSGDEISQFSDWGKYSADIFIAKKRKSIDDSCEIFLENEFIGLVYVEEDEGETSYQFHMTILKEDLLNS